MPVGEDERSAGERAGPTRADDERVKALEREHRDLKRADEILRNASAVLMAAGAPDPELDRLTR